MRRGFLGSGRGCGFLDRSRDHGIGFAIVHLFVFLHDSVQLSISLIVISDIAFRRHLAYVAEPRLNHIQGGTKRRQTRGEGDATIVCVGEAILSQPIILFGVIGLAYMFNSACPPCTKRFRVQIARYALFASLLPTGRLKHKLDFIICGVTRQNIIPNQNGVVAAKNDIAGRGFLLLKGVGKRVGLIPLPEGIS